MVSRLWIVFCHVQWNLIFDVNLCFFLVLHTNALALLGFSNKALWLTRTISCVRKRVLLGVYWPCELQWEMEALSGLETTFPFHKWHDAFSSSPATYSVHLNSLWALTISYRLVTFCNTVWEQFKNLLLFSFLLLYVEFGEIIKIPVIFVYKWKHQLCWQYLISNSKNNFWV